MEQEEQYGSDRESTKHEGKRLTLSKLWDEILNVYIFPRSSNEVLSFPTVKV